MITTEFCSTKAPSQFHPRLHVVQSEMKSSFVTRNFIHSDIISNENVEKRKNRVKCNWNIFCLLLEKCFDKFASNCHWSQENEQKKCKNCIHDARCLHHNHKRSSLRSEPRRKFPSHLKPNWGRKEEEQCAYKLKQ